MNLHTYLLVRFYCLKKEAIHLLFKNTLKNVYA